MKHSLLILCFLASLGTKAQSHDEQPVFHTEEVSYDDLVNELSAKKKRSEARAEGSAFDQIQVHGGMGMINSFSTFRIRNKNEARYQNGLQLSLGVDLFSPNWMTEVSWRNFGLTEHGSEEHTLREFGLKVGYRDQIEGPWSYRLQSGLAQRDLKLKDPARSLEVEASTPALIAGASAVLRMSPAASLQFEVGGRAPIVDETADKGSVDFSIELKLSL